MYKTSYILFALVAITTMAHGMNDQKPTLAIEIPGATRTQYTQNTTGQTPPALTRDRSVSSGSTGNRSPKVRATAFSATTPTVRNTLISPKQPSKLYSQQRRDSQEQFSDNDDQQSHQSDSNQEVYSDQEQVHGELTEVAYSPKEFALRKAARKIAKRKNRDGSSRSAIIARRKSSNDFFDE